MPTKPMTEKQADTWAWIKAYRAERGYSPTIQEIQSQFHLASTNAVASRLDAMERAGWIRNDPNLKQRAMIPIDANPQTTTKENKSAGRSRGNRRNQD